MCVPVRAPKVAFTATVGDPKVPDITMPKVLAPGVSMKYSAAVTLLLPVVASLIEALIDVAVATRNDDTGPTVSAALGVPSMVTKLIAPP